MSKRKPHWDKRCVCLKERAIFSIQELNMRDYHYKLGTELNSVKVPRLYRKENSYQIRTKPKYCKHCLVREILKRYPIIDFVGEKSLISFDNPSKMQKYLHKLSYWWGKMGMEWVEYQQKRRKTNLFSFFSPMDFPLVVFQHNKAIEKYNEEVGEEEKQLWDTTYNLGYIDALNCVRSGTNYLEQRILEGKI